MTKRTGLIARGCDISVDSCRMSTAISYILGSSARAYCNPADEMMSLYSSEQTPEHVMISSCGKKRILLTSFGSSAN